MFINASSLQSVVLACKRISKESCNPETRAFAYDVFTAFKMKMDTEPLAIRYMIHDERATEFKDVILQLIFCLCLNRELEDARLALCKVADEHQ